ncbi:hypothetical protein KGM_208859 [Danaus plexippus plexippus]|uniref:Uncharacterized protein n=1 Tax=Danaus plexippus plexippus TaxID=278856 RepID=A0A212FE40_DANPL|nr:hypothetical protein KGM_208859 [Danaus plexippus plexippus]
MCTEVDGRYVQQHETNRKISDNIERKHPSHNPERHSRNRRQSYFSNDPDYVRLYRNNRLDDYLTDMTFSIRDIAASLNHLTRNQYNPFNYDRREYSCNCDESIRKLLSIVEELASRAKNPPSPPPPPSIQVVYIPYQVPENIKGVLEKNMSVGFRIDVDDKNRIWPNNPREVSAEDEENDGSRPISFKPVSPKRPTSKPPPFDHGSKQEGIQTTTPVSIKKHTLCEGAILTCCGLKNEERSECFTSYKCLKNYDLEQACHPQVVAAVLDKFQKLYGPNNDY